MINNENIAGQSETPYVAATSIKDPRFKRQKDAFKDDFGHYHSYADIDKWLGTVLGKKVNLKQETLIDIPPVMTSLLESGNTDYRDLWERLNQVYGPQEEDEAGRLVEADFAQFKSDIAERIPTLTNPTDLSFDMFPGFDKAVNTALEQGVTVSELSDWLTTDVADKEGKLTTKSVIGRQSLVTRRNKIIRRWYKEGKGVDELSNHFSLNDDRIETIVKDKK